MMYPNSMYSSVDEYTSGDLAQLQVTGMRRNSFVVTICSLIALASVSIYGLEINLIIPIVGVGLTSLFIAVYLKDRYLVASQRALVAIVFVSIAYLSSVSHSVTTTILFVPLYTFIFFIEREYLIRLFYAVVGGVILYFSFSRFYPGVGIEGVSASLLRVESFTDCLLAMLFTGIFIRSHSVFSRLTIEVAKSQAIRLEQSVAETEKTIATLEERREHLSAIREQTSSAIENERVAAREIRASQEQLEQFAYAASHDLKEPIRTVRSFYQVIRRRVSPEVLAEAEISDLIALVEGRSSTMHNMLERLLLFSRVSSGGGRSQEIDLKSLLEEALILQEAKPLLAIELQKGSETVALDLTCVKRVFKEIVANSISYSREGHLLALVFKAERMRAGFITCSLSDNGIGMAAGDLTKAVGLFQRLHKDEANTGSGLGLSIAKAIVEREGGELWLTSDGDFGTTVYFELPEA